MSKLWSATNIRVAGTGLTEDKFLSFLSSLIGDHDVTKRSSSSQTKGRSVTTSIQRERIFDVADLTAMPRGRAVMLASGVPAALVKLDHYSTAQYAEQVTQSKSYYEGLAVKEGRPPVGAVSHCAAADVLPERRFMGARLAPTALSKKPSNASLGP
jgi:type IV secretory pathway TraG/TraD family ATPase VirD4